MQGNLELLEFECALQQVKRMNCIDNFACEQSATSHCL